MSDDIKECFIDKCKRGHTIEEATEIFIKEYAEELQDKDDAPKSLSDGTKVWISGKVVGTKGETGIRVHIDSKGNIHGYPVNPGRYLPSR